MGWSSFRDSITKPGKDLGDSISKPFQDLSGRTGEKAALEASKEQSEMVAGSVADQISYLKEINKLPQQYKEQALTRLSDISSGGATGIEAQQGMIDQAKASPYYQEMMGGKVAGEEGVMRNAAMTGGLRSGNVQSALYDYNAQLENQALSGSYNQLMGGLEGLAGLQTNEQQIGQAYGGYADVAAINAAGTIGAAQSRQQGTQNMANMAFGLGSMLI